MTIKNMKCFFTRLVPFFLVCILLSSCESRRTIVNGLDEKEANEILVFLANRGIDATKIQGTEGSGGGSSKVVLWNISVESTQATEAMAILNQAGLPRRRGQNLLSIFKDVGLVPSEMQEKIRYQAGLAEQIASTIRKIDGILDADVQVSFPEEDPLNPNAPKQKITASVYVKHSGVLDDPNAHLVTRIKRLVASSVPGLDYDNVTVIGDRARFSDTSTTLLETQIEEEKHYVHIWTLVLAKESVTRFRIIFFSFMASILVLVLIVIWIFWKFLPLLKFHGGFKELLKFSPIHMDANEEQDKKGKIKNGDKNKKESKEEMKETDEEDENQSNKDFDET